ncbi:TonB-dependent receptor [Sphingomonas sp. IC-56]|uniref:outer membrane beta-barrel family protein n=1 Tax=Sphingomonas sp. IC-56 TaxID=2898529 RepID=UPI001E34AD19|nr:outer membrane beta-barrel family protein [Sphingomonas sp. IC-56]MCD2325371.1 TonB-dependent receptor [Sphingomonas sp. IC-56]
MAATSLLAAASVLALAAQAAPTTTQQQPAAPPAAPPRDDVVVTGARSDVVGSTDRLSFNVANDLNVQNGTLADALRAVPGVDVDLDGRVSLRGDPGVTIMIDGRPSALLRGESRGDALQSMPAGQIERVEIITNPSAAMSPEGAGGVINLVTKQVRKGARYATIRAAAGPLGRGNVSANGALSGKKLTLTGDVAYRRFRSETEATLDRERTDPATGITVRTRQVSEVEPVMAMHSARVGAEYNMSANSKLTGDLSYRAGTQDISRIDRSVSDLPAATFDRTADMDMRLRSLGARTSWRRTLPGRGHELVVDLEVEQLQQRRRIDGATDFASAPWSFEQIATDIDRTDIDSRIDYKRPIGTGSLNLGYEGDYNMAAFDFRGVRGGSLDALAPVPSLTNRFDFDQAVHAFYGTYQIDLGKWEMQLGLRGEQAVLDIDQRTDAVRIQRDYFRLYPTAHVGYELSATEQLRASYSRRIQRPSGQDLSPYTIYLDPLNLRRGNPFLRPELTDSFEASWQRRKGGTFYSLTAFFRTSRDGVTDVVEDIGNNVFLNTRANLATGERIGMEAVLSGRLSKKLTYNASGGFLWNEIDPRQAGVSRRRSGTTGTARASLTWQPSARDFVQLSGNYSGPQLIAQGYRKPGGIVNVGYRRKIDDRFSLTFTGQNILDTAQQETVIDTPQLRDRIRQKGPGPILLFGLTWNLGAQTARKRPEPGFDFDQSATAPVG